MVSCIILAAGSGKRMGKSINKVYLDLNGHPILFYSIRAFQEHSGIDEIILVMKQEEISEYGENLGVKQFSKVKAVVAGGAERMHSVQKGLAAVSQETDLVLIHDGARPFVSEKLISDAIRFAGEYGASCPAVVPKDTIKVAGEDELIRESLRRDALRAVQTPQAFRKSTLDRLLKEALTQGVLYTDETTLFTDAGLPVRLFPGDYSNLKVTTAEDLALAGIIAGE